MPFDKNRYFKQRYRKTLSENPHYTTEKYYKSLMNLRPYNLSYQYFFAWRCALAKTKIVLQKHQKQEHKYMLNKFFNLWRRMRVSRRPVRSNVVVL